MKDYIILTDSTTDLPQKYMEDNGIGYIEFSYMLDGKSYYDDLGKSSDPKEFYKLMKESEALPSTTQINQTAYIEFFTKYADEGKNIIYICFSSGLSGSYNSALMAAKEVMEKKKDISISVIDSLCASLGEGLLVHDAVQKREGLDYNEMVEYLEKRKMQLVHWFTVDSLHHLHRGGRVSKTSAILGSLLNIKPILNVDENGKLVSREKQRGRKASLINLVEKICRYIVEPESQTVFISHGDCPDEAQFVADELKKRISVKDTMINIIGPVIGAHSGPGTIAVFFFGKDRSL